MRDAGYYTANVRHLPKRLGFEGTAKTDWNFNQKERPFDTDRWADLPGHQPFFAQINFQETHRKFHAPRRADPAKVEVPPYEPDHPVTRADRAAYLDAASELDRKVGLVLDQLAADGLADNTVIVFFGDNGQAHVRGKQFCYEEGLNVPLIVTWPKRLPTPRQFRPGTIDDRLLAAIDLAPTMLALVGAAKPARMQGEVFLGDRAGGPRRYVFGARDRCDETVFRLRTVREARYRYIRNFTPERPFLQANTYKEGSYPVWNLLKQLHAAGKLTPVQERLCAPTMPAEELYDLERDPHEIDNLADRPEHGATLARLRKVLEEWIEATNDRGRTLEPPELARRRGVTDPATPPNSGYALPATEDAGRTRREGGRKRSPRAADPADKDSEFHFGVGKWDRSRWAAVRLANQPAAREFSQLEAGIGTTRTTFSEQDYSRETDNAILLHDLGTAEAQVDVAFTIGRGFRGSSAPGLCIAPRVKEGLVESCLAVFVADYAMAAWYQDTLPDGKTVRYRHLVQLARWTDPARRHVLRCRVSRKESAVALQVDDSDVAVLSFVGNPALSFVPGKLNGVVGLWACHGACTFHELRVHRPGVLPFLVRKPAVP